MSNVKKAYLAGGCFWGLEELFRKQPGVLNVVAGYTGGDNDDPTYENHPGHAEALEIEYDTDKTDLRHLLDYFFQAHDPTTLNQQGNDRGESYRSAIFYQDDEEKQIAQEMIGTVDKSLRWDNPVVTSLEPFKSFHKAEEYHQDYLQKNPGGYTCHFIRDGGSYLK